MNYKGFEISAFGNSFTISLDDYQFTQTFKAEQAAKEYIDQKEEIMRLDATF